jgi:hypothetical protein
MLNEESPQNQVKSNDISTKKVDQQNDKNERDLNEQNQAYKTNGQETINDLVKHLDNVVQLSL